MCVFHNSLAYHETPSSAESLVCTYESMNRARQASRLAAVYRGDYWLSLVDTLSRYSLAKAVGSRDKA